MQHLAEFARIVLGESSFTRRMGVSQSMTCRLTDEGHGCAKEDFNIRDESEESTMTIEIRSGPTGETCGSCLRNTVLGCSVDSKQVQSADDACDKWYPSYPVIPDLEIDEEMEFRACYEMESKDLSVLLILADWIEERGQLRRAVALRWLVQMLEAIQLKESKK